VNAQLGLLGGTWERNLKEITDALKPLYKPQSKQFNITINNIELPTNPVNYGDNVVMSVTLTNNSNFILLKGSASEPIMNLDVVVPVSSF